MPKNSGILATVSLSALIALVLTGCTPSPTADPTDTDDRPFVVTTFTVIADMVEQVGGDRVRVE
jgi:manganese transport system substrate-binding protein